MPTATLLCRFCKSRFPRESMLTLPNGAYCTMDHAIAYGREQGQKLRQRKHREQRKVDNEQKREFQRKDYSYQFQLTKKAAQKLANQLDAELPCICCDAPRGNAQFCGGHAKSAGAHPELALDLRNIHGQRNALCNRHKSGNWSGDKHSKGYKQGLIDRYGHGLVEWLESYHPPAKRTTDDLIALRKVYAEEIRRLEQGLEPSKNWRAFP